MLEPYIADDVLQPNGDRNMHCPIHGDANRSATVNFTTQEWNCFSCEDGGTLGKLIERKDEWFDPGQTTSKTARNGAVRELPSDSMLDGWHSALLSSERWLTRIQQEKGITVETIQRFGLGLNRNWIMFPVIDKDGKLQNIRQYNFDPKPGDTKVMHWAGHGRPVRLYPIDILIDDPKELWIVEGEWDVLIANQYGLPAITTTGAVGAIRLWKEEWTEWLKGKFIHICLDRDMNGHKAAKGMAERIKGKVKYEIIQLPYSLKSKKDISDFFLEGKTVQDLLDCRRSESTEQEKAVDNGLERVKFSDLRRPSRFKHKDVIVEATPAVINDGQSIIPHQVTGKCNMDWVPQKCKHCPLNGLNGKRIMDIHHTDPFVIETMAGKRGDKQKRTEYLSMMEIPGPCNRVKFTESVLGWWPGEVRNGSNLAEDAFPIVMHQEGTSPNLNQPADFVGSIVSSPQAGKSVFMARKVIPKKLDLDTFSPTHRDIQTAKDLITGLGNAEPHEIVEYLATLFEKHVTKIFGQRMMHIAIDLVYHSVTRFKLGEDSVTRGWMEALAVGETRSGKSKTASEMIKMFGHGHLVGSENASIAGLLGGLEKSGSGIGSGMVRRSGTLPLHNRRLIVLDEAQGLPVSEISKMSDVRSRGEVQIEKIQKIEAQAMVRLVWLANDRDGMRFGRGIDALQAQMGAPEDLSRVDLPLYIRADVGDEIKKARHAYGDLPLRRETLSWLVMWAWSRTEDQVHFTDEAQVAVWEEAEDLARDFSTDIPIFPPNEAHIRLARLSVALAARLFSTKDGINLVIKQAHVLSASILYRAFLGHKDLGIIEIKENEEWRSEQQDFQTDKIEQLVKSMSAGTRQQIIDQAEFDVAFSHYEQKDWYKTELSNAGAVYPSHGELVFDPQFIDTVRNIHESLR
jgi:hypothetical protein